MTWSDVETRLSAAFVQLTHVVHQALPEILVAPDGYDPAVGRFAMSIGYYWDFGSPFGDVTVEFLGSHWYPIHPRPAELPKHAEYLMFEVTGTGEEGLDYTLGPQLVPFRPDQDEYWVMVSDFTAQAVHTLLELAPQIIEELRRVRPSPSSNPA